MPRDRGGSATAAGNPQAAQRFELGYGDGIRLHANEGDSENSERTTFLKGGFPSTEAHHTYGHVDHTRWIDPNGRRIALHIHRFDFSLAVE
jgi:hypothetical protein